MERKVTLSKFFVEALDPVYGSTGRFRLILEAKRSKDGTIELSASEDLFTHDEAIKLSSLYEANNIPSPIGHFGFESRW